MWISQKKWEDITTTASGHDKIANLENDKGPSEDMTDYSISTEKPNQSGTVYVYSSGCSSGHKQSSWLNFQKRGQK